MASADLTGYGARFRIQRVYSGIPPDPLELDEHRRTLIEQLHREIEAGRSVNTCGPGFTQRYALGATYLLFIVRDVVPDTWTAPAAFRVQGSDIVFHDPGLESANNGVLHVERQTYDRFFAGLPLNPETGCCYFTDGSVPLASVLSAVAALRGDPSIAPPNTGNAGLAAGRY